jgi:flagella basal body P-ring formation protein FlgA
MRWSIRLTLICLLPAVAPAGVPPASAQSIQPVESIAEAARAEALRLAPPGTAGLKVDEARVDDRLRLARCAAPLAARPAPGSRVGGRVTIEVECPGLGWRVFVPVTLALRLPVVVAARPLPVGQAIAPADLRLVQRDVHGLPRGYYTRIEDAVGLSVARALGAGEAVTPAVVRAGTLVRRGQQVILLARTDGLAVRMGGEALSDGGISQRIRVRNLSSGREVEGIVRSAGLVEVGM